MYTCEKINYRRTLDSDGLCVESALDKVLGGGPGPGLGLGGPRTVWRPRAGCWRGLMASGLGLWGGPRAGFEGGSGAGGPRAGCGGSRSEGGRRVWVC